MNFRNKLFIISFFIILIIILISVGYSVNGERDYINVTEDGAIKFDVSGFEVNQLDVIEEEFTGKLVNKTFYQLKDSFGREVEIIIHHTSINNDSSMESKFLSSQYLQSSPIWVGNYSGNYYSVSANSYDENYFNKEFIHQRIIVYQ